MAPYMKMEPMIGLADTAEGERGRRGGKRGGGGRREDGREKKFSDCERRCAAIAGKPVTGPLLEIAVKYRLPRRARERQQEMYIVQGEEAQSEYLVRHEKVPDVGSAESRTGRAIA